MAAHNSYVTSSPYKLLCNASISPASASPKTEIFSKTQSLKLFESLPVTTLSQATTQQPGGGQEKLNNPDWQEIPGVNSGNSRNPSSTLIDIRHITRKENTVTFDVTGHKGFYARYQGNCKTNQFRTLRFGRLLEDDTASYQINDKAENAQATDFERSLLNFACKQTATRKRKPRG